MKKEIAIGIAIAAAVLAGVIFYLATKPLPVKAPETGADTSGLSGTSFVEHAKYYDIAVNYASSTPLTGSSDSRALSLMKQFVSNTITQFKTDGNFANLTAEDVKMMGLSDDRKETLNIVYMIASSPRTISYLFTTSENTLGAHPNMFFHTFVFDTTTGAPLALGDIFLPGTSYLSTLSSLSRTRLPDSIGADFADKTMLESGTAPKEENFNKFFFDNSNLIILFDPYQVAAYAAGPQTIRIPLTELASILKPEYR